MTDPETLRAMSEGWTPPPREDREVPDFPAVSVMIGMAATLLCLIVGKWVAGALL